MHVQVIIMREGRYGSPRKDVVAMVMEPLV
jgi:hypothetical protein